MDGWTYNSNTRKCYKYFEKKTYWSTARKECQSTFTRGISSKSLIRGSLAIIENEEDVQLVLNNARNIKSGQIWLGGSRAQDGKWMWLDGTELQVGQWADNQPDNYGAGEDKLAMSKHTGMWNDGNENTKSGFVCQYFPSGM